MIGVMSGKEDTKMSKEKTDAEKMLETMMFMGKAASKEQQNQLNLAAQSIKQFYDSYVNAGFSNAQAMELTKELLRNAFLTGSKK